MKKVLLLIFASLLVLGACGNKEESKSEDKKETKSTDKEGKKDDKKKSNDDKEENKQVTENNNTQEQQSTQETIQTQEQQNTAEQPSQEPTNQKKMEANAKVAKEHGYTGIPNGDAGMLDENYSPESEQTYDYENNGVQRTPSEQRAHEEWVRGQDEWTNASDSEKEDIRKADAEKYGYKYDPNDYDN